MIDDVVTFHPKQPWEVEFLHERYGRAHRHGVRSYYAVKPLIPRRLQLAVRRADAQVRRRATSFPAWPIEPVLIRLRAAELERELARRGAGSLPVVNPWPGRARFAFVLTHDVESREGVDRMDELLDVERRYGVRSSWNFCAEWYPLSADDRARVVAAGCEVGLHGLRHDLSLLRDRAAWERSMPAIGGYLHEWGAVGFRSPAVLRHADWIHQLPAEYDSSFPDTDPFQAEPGGCCSVHPFFFGEVVELPVTLDQDFTLFELLGERTIDLWKRKAEWIVRQHGLVNVIVHPDYMTPQRLRLYEELLEFLVAQPGGWHALPRDVAAWWRSRADLRVAADGANVEGPRADGATVVHAWVEGEEIAYDT